MNTPHARPGDDVAVLMAVCLAALVLPLSFSGGAMATPAIGRELGGSPVALNWVTNAFMLSFGSSLMAAGSLADRYGRKRVFTLGVALFSLLSVALVLAPAVWVVDLLRALQGLAAAAALAGGSAALAQAFEGARQTRAFSLLGTSFGVGLAFGPLLAGVLTDTWGWRWAFISSALVGGSALCLAVPRMHESRDPQAQDFDWPGAMSFTAALSLLTFGLILAPEHGWQSPSVLGLLLGALLLFAAFVRIELKRARPMLDLSLFRYGRFIGVQMLPIATCYCYVVLLVLLPWRFIGIEGRGAIEAGLLLMALSAPLLVMPSLAAWLTRWYAPGVVCGVGLLLAALGLYALAGVRPGGGGGQAILPMLIIGCGAGLPWGLMDGLSVSVVPKERAGMASGIFSTTRVAGEGIALAMVTALLAGFVQADLATLTQGAAPVGEAAQRLATGDARGALQLLPALTPQAVVASYGHAFARLCALLIAMTVLSSGVAFVCLRGRSD